MPAPHVLAMQTLSIKAFSEKPMVTAGVADLILDILDEVQSGCTGRGSGACPFSLLLLGLPGTGQHRASPSWAPDVFSFVIEHKTVSCIHNKPFVHPCSDHMFPCTVNSTMLYS